MREILHVRRVIFCRLRGRDRHRPGGLLPSQFVLRVLLKCHPISRRPHFFILAGSSNFLRILSAVQITARLSAAARNISMKRLRSPLPFDTPASVSGAPAPPPPHHPQPQQRTPRSPNSIWSYLPSSHSADSVSVSGGVSKDHYHILPMSSFMAPVYSSAGAAHRL